MKGLRGAQKEGTGREGPPSPCEENRGPLALAMGLVGFELQATEGKKMQKDWH